MSETQETNMTEQPSEKATLPVAATPVAAMDFTVIATKPQEMADAQRSMIAWAAEKVEAVAAELKDAERSLDVAIASGWRLGPFERVVNNGARHLTFYEKIKAALEAGYYIVPPFPLDIFTIRTDRSIPRRKTSTYRWDRRLQAARLMAQGEGRYVSDEPEIYQRTIPAADSGTEKDVKEYFAKEFRDVAFPFALAKPQIMEATAAAMALKVFDQFGCLPGQRRSADPIICGQILKPDRWRTPITFFIAWWLDTRTL